MIAIDTRWTGSHGIGRYAAEVTARLDLPWVSLSAGGRPSQPKDFLTKSVRVNGEVPALIYSPGYNAFLRPVRQVITLHDLIHLDGEQAWKYKPYYNRFLRPLIKRNGVVLTVSSTSQQRIAEWLQDADVEIVNAGNGASPDFHPNGPVSRRRRDYFLYVGNLRPHKNLSTVLKAMKHLPDRELVAVLPSAERAHLAELATRYGVLDQLHMASDVPDEGLASLYRGAVATVFPSTREGFGLPALEAALCGSPVVFYQGCDSVREICAGGGISVAASQDEAEWAAAMESIPTGARFPKGVLDGSAYSWTSVAHRVQGVLSKMSNWS